MSEQLEKDLALIGRWAEKHGERVTLDPPKTQMDDWSAWTQGTGADGNRPRDAVRLLAKALAKKSAEHVSEYQGKAESYQDVIGDWTEEP
jgi:hypothetical protein